MAISAVMMLVAACAHEDSTQTAAAPPPPPPPVEPAPAPTMGTPAAGNPAMENGPTSADVPREGPNAGSNAGSTEPQPAPAMSDGQILQVTHVANVGEIDQAKLALVKSKDTRVRTFAQMMVRDHTQADKNGMLLAKKENIEREPSPTSEALTTDATSATASLKADPAADFDKSYVDTQVKEHQSVLDMLDQKLLVNVTNPAVKSYLTEVRAAVASHLQHAQELQAQMQK
jgi:putative membrane protein